MYVDKLDFSKVKFGKDGPPRSVKFTVASWNKEQVIAVLTNDRNPGMSYRKLQASFLRVYRCYTSVFIFFFGIPF